jgi:hypothetical protein
VALLGQQLPPDRDVPVLDLGQPRVHVPLGCVLLYLSQEPVQIRRIGLVLPMMLESVDIRHD